MSNDMEVIRYQTVAWMRPLKDIHNGKDYLELGPVDGNPDTLAVTPKGGNGATRFYCLKHQRAYHFRETCRECRMQVVKAEPEGVSQSRDTA